MRGKCKTIAINSSYRLAPWADVLYAYDMEWWREFEGAPEFEGLKIGGPEAAKLCPEVHPITIPRAHGRFSDEILTDQAAVIGGGRNSGFQASNLAVQFGVWAIVWIGFDMRVDRGVHWHGPHPPSLRNPKPSNADQWRVCLDAQAHTFTRLGVTVINASPQSALKAYPKMTIGQALQMLGLS